MRFTWDKTGDRVFTGPPVHRGALAGFTMNEQKVARMRLKLDSLETLDSGAVTILYYVLSIRREDHTVLPIENFGDLTALEFDVAAHPFDLDTDDTGERETCRECNNYRTFRAHNGLDPVGPTEPAESSPSTS